MVLFFLSSLSPFLPFLSASWSLLLSQGTNWWCEENFSWQEECRHAAEGPCPHVQSLSKVPVTACHALLSLLSQPMQESYMSSPGRGRKQSHACLMPGRNVCSKLQRAKTGMSPIQLLVLYIENRRMRELGRRDILGRLRRRRE